MPKLSHFIIYSRVATLIATLLCMGIWIYTIVQGHTGGPLTYLNLLLYLIFGMLIGNTGERTDTSSRKPTLGATLFFMSCALNPQFAPWQESTLCLMLIGTAYHIIAGTYRSRTAMGSYFAAFCMIGIATLYAPQLLYLTPLLILCCGFMQSLHLRTLLAALFGLLAPYWTAFCILFLTDSTHLIQPFVEELTTLASHTSQPLHIPISGGHTLAIPMMAVQCVWTLLLALPAIVHHIVAGTTKVKFRAARYVQLGSLGTLLIGTLLLPSLYATLYPVVVALTASISYGFFATDNRSRGQNIWLITLFIIWLLILSLYVWNSFIIY